MTPIRARMGRPAHARASFIASEGWAQDRPEPPTQSPVTLDLRRGYVASCPPRQVNDSNKGSNGPAGCEVPSVRRSNTVTTFRLFLKIRNKPSEPKHVFSTIKTHSSNSTYRTPPEKNVFRIHPTSSKTPPCQREASEALEWRRMPPPSMLPTTASTVCVTTA